MTEPSPLPRRLLRCADDTLRNVDRNTMLEAADAIEALVKEHAEDQSVIAVWRGRTERAEAERDEALRHVEQLKAKLDPKNSCACCYDVPDTICGHHSPMLAKAEAERDKDTHHIADLIARLLAETDGATVNPDGQEAADAIKALVAERDAARADLRHVIAERDRTFALVVGQRDEARGWAQHWQAEAAEDGAALQAAEAERDAAHALLREAMDWMPAQWPGENGRKLTDIRARIDALLAEKEGTT